MAVIITGTNTPTAGGVTYGDGSTYANTAAGTSGQFLQSNGASAPTWTTLATGLTLGTPVASTSGTSITFTGIPAGTKQVIFSFSGVSTSGTDNMLLRIGPSAGLAVTGYLSNSSSFPGGTTTQVNSTAGIVISSASATQNRSGSVVFILESSAANTWAVQGTICITSASNTTSTVAGRVSLSGIITQISLTTTGGTDTFDLGEVNIAYA